MIPQILKVDFDDTLFLHSFPYNFSEPNWKVINYVKNRKNQGWYIILDTCRTKPEFLDSAIKACAEVGIEFDAINENHPALIEKFGDCRKIFCHESIDDRNITLDSIAYVFTQEEIFNFFIFNKHYIPSAAKYYTERVLKFEPSLRIAFENYMLTDEIPEFVYNNWTLELIEQASHSKLPYTFIHMDNLMKDPNYAKYFNLKLFNEE